jgi:hypothetical protein
MVAAGALATACAAACSSANTGGAAGGNGVDDVKAACAIRVGWTHTASDGCTHCLNEAPNTPCDCDPSQGVCAPQNRAKAAEVDCTADIASCITACSNDCACIDNCYAGHAKCRAAASALDGCIAQACDQSCR